MAIEAAGTSAAGMSRRMPLAEIEHRHNSIGLLTTLISAAQLITRSIKGRPLAG
jgi:hypothetical protein